MKAAELACARVQVPDLDVAERFFHTFGLRTRVRTEDRLYLHGTGPEHHLLVVHRGERRFLAMIFQAANDADLEQASLLPGASPIQRIDEPGGGRVVFLCDPDGNSVEFVSGQVRCDALASPVRDLNSAGRREQRRNSVIRLKRAPAQVSRIGHVVLRTPDVNGLSAWYRSTLGLLASDDVPTPDGANLLMSFLRLDQGEQAVDHHVFQALVGPANALHHISFEVQDIDDLHLGHYALGEAGYDHVWGIGRHLQGSQIFDYWLDPFGVMYEHWTDTDMLDATVPVQIIPADQLETPWAPNMPTAFMEHGTL